MIVDSSALVAVVLGEMDAEAILGTHCSSTATTFVKQYLRGLAQVRLHRASEGLPDLPSSLARPIAIEHLSYVA